MTETLTKEAVEMADSHAVHNLIVQMGRHPYQALPLMENGPSPNEVLGAIFELRADKSALASEVWRLREELARERQAAASIAVACLNTGLVPKGVEGNVEAVKAVCDEADRLRELESRLPKTADGVSIMPGMEVWAWDCNIPVKIVVKAGYMRRGKWTVKPQSQNPTVFGRILNIPADQVFVDKAAAEAARVLAAGREGEDE